MNILFVNYGDFSTNSLNHIGPFANHLVTLGHHCIVAVPGQLASQSHIEEILFQPTTYTEALSLEGHFPNGQPADIIHGWTPRINVASFISRYRDRYGKDSRLVIHMEDNEIAIIEDFYKLSSNDLANLKMPPGRDVWEPMLAHPLQYQQLLESADAYTVVIDTLFDFLPRDRPRLELLPGLDLHAPKTKTPNYKTTPDEQIIVYSGGVSSSNLNDIANLYDAVHQVRQAGANLRLLKTGPNHPQLASTCRFDPTGYVTDLGFLPKHQLLELLTCADALIQPGQNDPFNDYRLPSKLPEFLASAKPVITGRTNLGLRLRHLHEAYIFELSTPESIAKAYLEIANNPKLSKTIGKNGRAFAEAHFNLEKNGDKLLRFYQSIPPRRPLLKGNRTKIGGPFATISQHGIAPKKRAIKNLKPSFLSQIIPTLNKRKITAQPNYRIPSQAPDLDKYTLPIRETNYTSFLKEEAAQTETFCSRFAEISNNNQSQPLLSLVMPTFRPDRELLESAIESVRSQIYPNWELCIADDHSDDPELETYLLKLANQDKRIRVTLRKENGHIAAASNSALKLASGEYIGFIDQDDTIPKHALAKFAVAINDNRTAAILYSDEDKIDLAGQRESPYFKPDWDPIFACAQHFVGHLCFYRAKLIRTIGGFNTCLAGSQDWDLLLRATRLCDKRAIIHIPEILYHWRATLNSTATDASNKNYAYLAAKKAVSAHLQKLGYPFTLQEHKGIYLNPSFKSNHSPEVSLILETTATQSKVISISCKTNAISKLSFQSKLPSGTNPTLGSLRNAQIKESNSELICILREATKPTDEDWLEKLVAYAVQLRVGAVSPKIITIDGKVHSCGTTITKQGLRIAEFTGIPSLSDGYYHRALLSSCYDGITSECIVFRKAVWEEIGGYSEDHTDIETLDIDFCQKLQSTGYLSVLTPSVIATLTVSNSPTPKMAIQYEKHRI